MQMRKRSPADYADALIGLLVETANENSVSPEVLDGYRNMLRSTHALQSAADAATLLQFREAADRFRELKRKEIQEKALVEARMEVETLAPTTTAVATCVRAASVPPGV